eukprot:3264094-Rhodomonas_salina.1
MAAAWLEELAGSRADASRHATRSAPACSRRCAFPTLGSHPRRREPSTLVQPAERRPPSRGEGSATRRHCANEDHSPIDSDTRTCSPCLTYSESRCSSDARTVLAQCSTLTLLGSRCILIKVSRQLLPASLGGGNSSMQQR